MEQAPISRKKEEVSFGGAPAHNSEQMHLSFALCPSLLMVIWLMLWVQHREPLFHESSQVLPRPEVPKAGSPWLPGNSRQKAYTPAHTNRTELLGASHPAFS